MPFTSETGPAMARRRWAARSGEERTEHARRMAHARHRRDAPIGSDGALLPLHEAPGGRPPRADGPHARPADGGVTIPRHLARELWRLAQRGYLAGGDRPSPDLFALLRQLDTSARGGLS